MQTPKLSLRSAELTRIHAERQSAIIATVVQECPDPIPPHCLSLLRHAPESFDDLRYGTIANAAFNLHLSHRPVSLLTIQEELAKSQPKADLAEIFNFLKLQPMALTPGLLEWESEELWNAYSFRRKATLYHEASEAMISSPDQAESIDRHVRRALLDLDARKNGDGLPEIVCARNLLATQLPIPHLLIDGLLHQGSKLSLGGGSKTFKSWTFLSIAIAVATGTPWLGRPTTRAKVLIVNFEIAPVWMQFRLETLCRAGDLYPEPGWLDLWNLRGHSAPHSLIIPKIIARAKSLGYGLVIIDPSYKLIGSGDENSASDVGAMMNSFELITTETTAAVAFGAHFAKGNAAQKEAIDRISGSGVFARDPDSILTFTPHERPDCFTVEATLRNLPHLEPFVVQWAFPQFIIQPDLNPSDLKKRSGRPKSFSNDAVLDLLKDASLSTKDWQTQAQTELGISRSLFYTIKDQLYTSERIIKSRINGLWTSVNA